MGRGLWQRRVDVPDRPGLVDAPTANPALAEAEAALRAGEISSAETIYLQILAHPDPSAESGPPDPSQAADQRTRSQCHARLAALALDQDDRERSLRETAAAAAARRRAIADDRCTAEDVRFMITALVHAATVHDQLGAHEEAITSCRVALEFADYGQTHDHDPQTRRSVASARRAATRLLTELTAVPVEAPAPTPTESGSQAGDAAVTAAPEDSSPSALPDDLVIDLTDAAPLPTPAALEPALEPTSDQPRWPEIIDLTEPAPVLAPLELVPEIIDLTDGADPDDLGFDEVGDDDLLAPGNGRFELHTDRHRERQAARRAEREAQRQGDPRPSTPDRRRSGHVLEPAATLLGRARADAALARALLGQGDGAASINAHRAVRTATRARPWAKHDEKAAAQVALALVDALVTRSDVLAGGGSDEGGGTDLRRARAIAEHLWRACPSAASAAAVILVCTRSAVREWDRGDTAATASYLEQAVQVMGEADDLGIELSAALTSYEAPTDEASDRDQLVAFGDQVFTALELDSLDVALVTT